MKAFVSSTKAVACAFAALSILFAAPASRAANEDETRFPADPACGAAADEFNGLVDRAFEHCRAAPDCAGLEASALAAWAYRAPEAAARCARNALTARLSAARTAQCRAGMDALEPDIIAAGMRRGVAAVLSEIREGALGVALNREWRDASAGITIAETPGSDCALAIAPDLASELRRLVRWLGAPRVHRETPPVVASEERWRAPDEIVEINPPAAFLDALADRARCLVERSIDEARRAQRIDALAPLDQLPLEAAARNASVRFPFCADFPSIREDVRRVFLGLTFETKTH